MPVTIVDKRIFMLNFNVLDDVLKQQSKAQSVLHILQDIISRSTSYVTCTTCHRIITRGAMNPFSVSSTFYTYGPDNFFDFEINVYVLLPDPTKTMSYDYWINALEVIQEAIELYRSKMTRYERTAHGTCTMLKPILYERTCEATSKIVPIRIEELVDCQYAVQKK